ncbi:MAG: hypothetical protein UR96_C0003G0010 [candidate division WS6 bacterium GW2011_GWC1_36_11]|uniref:Uncharacterized protein n=1 Tax=candidate division WS6 bacterium GW2011_GWC1_36_11 TaxID=1619090 RepID=A0A0G0DF17_9BACT|nr:MAG: hypothetical protein UR96_C0003G0010 [candidate division WS6 bacterium GW2011_GWC1_36_11]
MKKYRLKVQNDIIYLFILLAITEFFSYLVLNTRGLALTITGGLGILLLETWFIRTFRLYSGKKISKYSDVIVRISLKERFFSYFVLPLLFYVSILAFLYFNRNVLLGHVVLGICMVLFLILFLNVKSSLNKIYSVANATRAIFDFICITILYLLTNIFARVGLSMWIFALVLFVTTLVLLLFSLKLHKKLGFVEILISKLSAIFITCITTIFWSTNIFVIPLIAALAFYLVISIWNIRFSGKIHLVDYILPFLYVVLALILILTI